MSDNSLAPSVGGQTALCPALLVPMNEILVWLYSVSCSSVSVHVVLGALQMLLATGSDLGSSQVCTFHFAQLVLFCLLWLEFTVQRSVIVHAGFATRSAQHGHVSSFDGPDNQRWPRSIALPSVGSFPIQCHMLL